ncbi:MAG: DUF2520 domain-containing protein [Planctomycetes bacterium]|nr:DUF2520 domain-containing protein [Planctomycetota bacterium]
MDTPRIAILGPGRLGQVLARRWCEAGLPLLGFLGRDPERARAAVAFAGGGRVLDVAALRGADVVLVAVQDDRLPAVVAEVVAESKGVCGGLWVHGSGSHDLDVLEPARRGGARVGSLHPACALPTPEVGYASLPGQPAVLLARPDDPRTAAELVQLATAAGLRPVPAGGSDRLLYHTACVLAANGLTALYSVVADLLQRAAPGAALVEVGDALMRGALDGCVRHGAAAALSGPVVRGDAALVARQVARLDCSDPSAAAVYRSLMKRAVELAAGRGELAGQALAAVQGALAGSDDSASEGGPWPK